MTAFAFHSIESSTISAVMFPRLFFAKLRVEVKNNVKHKNDNKHYNNVDA